MPNVPFRHYALSMDISSLILRVNVRDLAAATGIPVRTLYRWAEDNHIPGRAMQREFFLSQIKVAAKKLPTKVNRRAA